MGAFAGVLADQDAAAEDGCRRDRRDRAQDRSSPQRLPGAFAADLPQRALEQQVTAFRGPVEERLRGHFAERGLHVPQPVQFVAALLARRHVFVDGSHLLLIERAEDVGAEQFAVMFLGAHTATPFNATSFTAFGLSAYMSRRAFNA